MVDLNQISGFYESSSPYTKELHIMWILPKACGITVLNGAKALSRSKD